MIKIDPTSAVAYFNRGNVHDQMGEHERAIADYSEAIKLDPTDADVFNNRGQSYDTKGEPDLAIADYSQSIRSTAKTSCLLQPRPRLRQQDEYPRAVDDFDRRSSSIRATRRPM